MEIELIRDRLRKLPIYLEYDRLMLPIMRSKDDKEIVYVDEKEFKRVCKRLRLNYTWDVFGKCVIVPKKVTECHSGHLKECKESTNAGRNSEVIVYCKDFAKLKYEEHAWCSTGDKIKVEIS